MKLINMKCSSCNKGTSKLTVKEINTNLGEIYEWRLNDEKNMIYKKYKFSNFVNALKFTNKVGEISENEKHHPDISLGYGYCLIMIHTHAIKGLSVNDFILASKIDYIDI